MTSPAAVSRRLIAEYNKGSPGWVDAVHAATTDWVELSFLGGILTDGRVIREVDYVIPMPA